MRRTLWITCRSDQEGEIAKIQRLTGCHYPPRGPGCRWVESPEGSAGQGDRCLRSPAGGTPGRHASSPQALVQSVSPRCNAPPPLARRRPQPRPPDRPPCPRQCAWEPRAGALQGAGSPRRGPGRMRAALRKPRRRGEGRWLRFLGGGGGDRAGAGAGAMNPL